MFLRHAPAKVLAVILDRRGLASFVSQSESPAPSDFGLSYGGVLPQEDQYDAWVGIADYAQVAQGRLMETGEYSFYPRVQIRVRHTEYDSAYARITEIGRYLVEDDDGQGLLSAGPFRLQIGADWLRVQNVSFVSGPLFMGDEEKNRRLSFVLNVQMTLTME